MSQVRVAGDLRKMLLADEEVLLAVKQSRLKALFTPDTIAVTNHRIIRYSPSGFLGIRKDIEDYRYEDVANFKISKGLMFSRVTISHRFMSESLVLDGLPNRAALDISKAVQENLRKTRSGVAYQPQPQAPPPDSMEVLKMRFARGEITKEQFEEMKRALG